MLDGVDVVDVVDVVDLPLDPVDDCSRAASSKDATAFSDASPAASKRS